MTASPPDIKKTLSEFMADLDDGTVQAHEEQEDLAWIIEASESAGEDFDHIEVSATFRPLSSYADPVTNEGGESYLIAASEQPDLSFDEDEYAAALAEAEPTAQEFDDTYFASEEAERLEHPVITFPSLGGALDDDDIEDITSDAMAASSGNTRAVMMIAATLLVFVGSALFFAKEIQNAGKGVFSDAAVAVDGTADRSERVIVPAAARTVVR